MRNTKTLRFCFLKPPSLVAHDCGYPLSRYTCRATRVAAEFLDLRAFCRCSTGVAPVSRYTPPKILVSHLPPPCAGRCRTEMWVWKGVALHGGVAATVAGVPLHCATKPPSQSPFFSAPTLPTFAGVLFKGQHDLGQHDPQLWEENGTLRGSLRGSLKNLWKPLKTSKNIWNPLKTSENRGKPLKPSPSQRSSQRPSQRQISLSEPLSPVAPNRVAPWNSYNTWEQNCYMLRPLCGC